MLNPKRDETRRAGSIIAGQIQETTGTEFKQLGSKEGTRRNPGRVGDSRGLGGARGAKTPNADDLSCALTASCL